MNGSATRSDTITAPIGAYAEVMPLAVVIMSGTTPKRSTPNQWPRRPQEQITSSAISSTLCRSQISRTRCQ